MARETFKLEGLKELETALLELPEATSKSVQLRTLKKEAQPIADLAARLAPDDPKTGGKDLHTSILVRAVPVRQRTSATEVAVGPSRKTFWGLFQELGTANHAPHPFLRPAFDSLVMSVMNNIGSRLKEEIEKTRQRLARKAEREAAKSSK